VATLAAVLYPQGTWGQKTETSEYRIKAAFLVHFAQYVEWPAGTFRHEDAPLVYCVLGKDRFGGAIELALGGKSVGSHELQLRHLTLVGEVPVCQVLFVAARNKKTIAAVLEGVKDIPVLTVGDSDHFVQAGGIIRLFLTDNKVRFEINVGAAQLAGLKVGAPLLTLASRVVGGSKGG
jgi:hypothetical protein